MLSIFKRKRDDGGEDLPWSGRPSIYVFLKENIDGQTGCLPKNFDKLPDDEMRFKKGELRWVAGGWDGAFGHHGGGYQDQDIKLSKKIAYLLKAISGSGKLSDKVKLFKLLQADSIMDYIDKALEEIVALDIPIEPHLHTFARFLAEESPDRGPVKFGIALLGIIRDTGDKSTIMLLGKHDEFTLFSAVALTNMAEDPEMDLYNLAQCVDGWGKIQLVEHLEGTNKKEIKDWMIRDGYKNYVMYEYLAYVCAQTGDLKEALKAATLDKDLFDSSGDLIRALINSFTDRNIDDFEFAAEVITLYLYHFDEHPKDLEHFLVLNTIKGYLSDEEWDDEKRKSNGWEPGLREQVLSNLNTLLGENEWRLITERDLQSSDMNLLFDADRAAQYLGIDTWDIHWQRLKEKPLDSNRWFFVMRDSNSERMDRILFLAESVIPFDDIATGPSKEFGVGPEYNWHSVLDDILPGLEQYPGKGEKLILTGLASPVIRNRNMALKVIAAWSLEMRGENIRNALQSAYEREPDKEVKDNIKKVMNGKSLDY